MKILIQDTSLRCSYLLTEREIEKFSVPFEKRDMVMADLIFVLPNDSLVDELQEPKLNEGPILKIAIIDSRNGKIINLSREDLELFEVENNFHPDSDTISFSIPSSLELVEQVDLFRRALVQNSS